MSGSSPDQDATLINQLDAQFSAMAERVEQLDFTIDLNNPASLLHTQDVLANIISDLQKLQSAEVSLPDLGGARRPLRDEIDELLEQTVFLHRQLTSSIMKAVTMSSQDETAQESAGVENVEDEEGEDDVEEEAPMSYSTDPRSELRRDEIARLLLLVSRAFAYKQLTEEEKTLIKLEIIQKKSYLRQAMASESINEVMTAIKTYARRLVELRNSGK